MSHFSTIKTQLKESKPLIKALNQLGYVINQEEKFVKGYKGQFTAVDISMDLPNNTKVGFKWDNNSNSYELVTDLDLWKFDLPVERFISKVTQMYAYHTIISKSEDDGYQIVEQKNKNDGSIELVLTKWESQPLDINSKSKLDNINEIRELTGFEPVLGGGLTEKAIWVDESRCIGCRYCAHVATNTFIVDEDYGRSRAIRQDGDNLETLEEAIDTCPVDCIHWVKFEDLEDLENSLDRDMFQSLGKLPRMNKH